MMDAALRRGFRDENGSWKTICIFRRITFSSLAPILKISVPSRRAAPAVGS